MKKYLQVGLFILIPVFLSAQTWEQVEGSYARVDYLPDLENVADSLLAIADNAIPRLAALQGVPIASFVNKKAHIIITDEPDVANGFAIANTVVIYARSSSYLKYWSGAHRWYKMVLEHELAHHVSFRAIWRKANYLGLIASTSTPRWFMEGIAQYLAETWTAYRGDVFLKKAVLNGRFSYNSLSDLNDGRLLYASGHAYVRYLASRFGDSSLIKLMNFDSSKFFYDFDAAFKSAYGKTPKALFPWFARHLIIYYGNKAADYPLPKFTSKLPSFGDRDDQIIPLSGKDSTFLVSTVAAKNHLYRTAAIYHVHKGNIHKDRVITDNYDTRLFVAPDDQKIAFGRYALSVNADQQHLAYDWFVYDRKTTSLQLLAKNIRAINAAFDSKGRLLLADVQADSSYIRRFDKDGKIKTLFRTKLPVGQLLIDANDALLFEMQRANSHRDLFRLSNKMLTALTDDSVDFRNFIALDKNHLVFNGMDERNPSVWVLDRNSGVSKMRVNGQFPLKLEGYYKADSSLILSYVDPGNKRQFATMPRDSILAKTIVPESIDAKPAYADWVKKTAHADSIPGQIADTKQAYVRSQVQFPQGNLVNALTMALPYKEPNSDWGVFLTSTWIEPMQRQLLAINALIYPADWENSLVSFGHVLRFSDLELETFYYHGPTIFSSFNNQYLALIHDVTALRLGINRFVSGNRREPYALFGGYSYTNIHDPDNGTSYNYQGPSVMLSMAWQKPSRYAFVFPKQALSLSAEYFKSLSQPFDFSVFQLHGEAASNLFLEELGITLKSSFIKSSGRIPDAGVTGIDRYFNFDVQRDYRYTQTVRGIDRDLLGDRLLWASGNISYYLTPNSGLTLLFLPISDVAISAFGDAARVWNGGLAQNALGYGGELSFGYPGIRFAVGYAQGVLAGVKQNARWYGRLSLQLNGVVGAALN